MAVGVCPYARTHSHAHTNAASWVGGLPGCSGHSLSHTQIHTTTYMEDT